MCPEHKPVDSWPSVLKTRKKNYSMQKKRGRPALHSEAPFLPSSVFPPDCKLLWILGGKKAGYNRQESHCLTMVTKQNSHIQLALNNCYNYQYAAGPKSKCIANTDLLSPKWSCNLPPMNLPKAQVQQENLLQVSVYPEAKSAGCSPMILSYSTF